MGILVTLHLSKVHLDAYSGYFHDIVGEKAINIDVPVVFAPMRK